MARSCACRRYGVRIESINVVSAVPASRELQDSLAQGAVAAAEAQKFATVARGKANASLIDAEAQARQTHSKPLGQSYCLATVARRVFVCIHTFRTAQESRS